MGNAIEDDLSCYIFSVFDSTFSRVISRGEPVSDATSPHPYPIAIQLGATLIC